MPVVGNYATRYRVRNAGKRWDDKGPDLLRTRESAKRQLANILYDLEGPFYVQVNDGPWRKVGSRANVMDRFKQWRGALFKVGIQKADVQAVAVCKRETVLISTLNNCSPATTLNWSLTHHQFPDAIFAGGYVWKQVSGSASWSDHAWGTAFDITQHGGDTCARITEWVARMGAARCMDYDYSLGTLNGRTVVYVAQDGDTRPSSAADSHLWHLHQSVVDHDGRKPPRQGGVW